MQERFTSEEAIKMQWSSKRGSIVKLSSVTKGEEKEIVTKVVEKKEPEDYFQRKKQMMNRWNKRSSRRQMQRLNKSEKMLKKRAMTTVSNQATRMVIKRD